MDAVVRRFARKERLKECVCFMKKLYPLISAAALLGLSAATTVPAMAASQATAVYVSTTGSDITGNGSSTAPYASISEAVSQVAPGGTVIVEPGTYKESVTIAEPLTLEADPSQTGAVTIDATGDVNGVVIQSSNVTVNGLTIENAQQAGLLAQGKGALSNLVIENNTLTKNDQGITPALIAQQVDYETLHVVGVQNSIISNNQVIDNLDGGLYVTDETASSTGNVISDNTVENNQVDCGVTLAGHAPGHGVNNNLIVANTATGNGAAGIMLATAVPGDSVSNNVVLDNTVSGNNYGGITLHTHAPGSTVNGNVIEDNTIGRNVDSLDLGYTAGVDLFAAGSAITNTVITGNSISGNYYAVAVTPWLSTGTVTTNNTYTKDGYKAPSWLNYQALVTGPTGATSIAPGLMGTSWAGAQADLTTLIKGGVKSNAAYVKLVHSKASGALEKAAQNLYTQYHVYN